VPSIVPGGNPVEHARQRQWEGKPVFAGQHEIVKPYERKE